MEKRYFIIKLGIFYRKIHTVNICISRIKELLDDKFNHKAYNHINESFLPKMFNGRRFITLTDVNQEIIDKWLTFCRRAKVEVEEVNDFF